MGDVMRVYKEVLNHRCSVCTYFIPGVLVEEAGQSIWALGFGSSNAKHSPMTYSLDGFLQIELLMSSMMTLVQRSYESCWVSMGGDAGFWNPSEIGHHKIFNIFIVIVPIIFLWLSHSILFFFFKRGLQHESIWYCSHLPWSIISRFLFPENCFTFMEQV